MIKYFSNVLKPKNMIFGLVGLSVLSAFTYAGYLANEAIKISKYPSSFSNAMNKLGFIDQKFIVQKDGKYYEKNTKAEEQQEALLKILYIAGYLTPENIWKDINLIGSIKNPYAFYLKIMPSFIKSGAVQEDFTKFDAKLLRKTLFRGTEFTDADAAEWLVYVTQHAFGRKPNQERNELVKQKWMEEFQKQYLTEVETLGLVDRIIPQKEEYDEVWIAGASRPALLARVIDIAQLINSRTLTINGSIRILAGERSLWAEIDGISDEYKRVLEDALATNKNIDLLPEYPGNTDASTNEGKKYIIDLATKTKTLLDPAEPLIFYLDDQHAPKGLVPNRHYPNYVKGENKRLTETVMAADLLSTYLPSYSEVIAVIDTSASEDGSRPTTSSTAKDVAEKFIDQILSSTEKKSSYNILLESNNPYTKRQEIAVQIEIDKILREKKLDLNITVEGVGFKNKQDLQQIHSEVGALVATMYQYSVLKGHLDSVRSENDLLYRSRNNDATFLEKAPELHLIKYDQTILEKFVAFFDGYLE
ncbi:MAG: hypothetical protein SFT93_01070 [Rickettsiaceae bacterium]|nr:hypothetical protein [Rickettsiaceae bacterium]